MDGRIAGRRTTPGKRVRGGRANEPAPLPHVFPRLSDPEEIRERPWQIRQSGQGDMSSGMTDLENHEIAVPLDDSPESLGIRQHEMLHVAMSPLHEEDGTDVALLAAEDGRIESVATRRGLVRESPMDSREVAGKIMGFLTKEPMGPDGAFLAACMGVAGVGSPMDAEIRELIGRHGVCEPVLEMMDRAAAAYAADESFASAVAVAEMLRKLSRKAPKRETQKGGALKVAVVTDGTPPPGAKPMTERPDIVLFAHTPKPKPRPKPGKGEGTADEPDDDKPGAGMSPDGAVNPDGIKSGDASMVPGEPQKSNVLPVSRLDLLADVPPADGNGKWNRLDWIAEPRRTVIIPPRAGGKRSRASDAGTVPNRMNRAALDNKVFASRRHQPQGTVLVDNSGSMSMSTDDLRALLEVVPAAVVATYNGRHDGGGEIRIVAANGRRVATKDMPRNVPGNNSGNDVDGLAIHWLARQRGPRVIVTDGFAGSDSGLSDKMVKDMADTIRRARITQVVPSYLRGTRLADCTTRSAIYDSSNFIEATTSRNDATWVADVLRHLR